MNQDVYWGLGALGLAAAGGGYAWWQHYSVQSKLTTFYGGLSTPSSDTKDASIWRLGPKLWQGNPLVLVNKSSGVPEIPLQGPDGPWFEYPLPGGSVHYMTHNPGSLAGKKSLHVRWRNEIPEGGEITPLTGIPGQPSEFTPGYIQRKRDNWSGADKYKLFRWFASKATVCPSVAGTFEATIPLDLDHWTPEDTIYVNGKVMDASTPEGRAYLQPYFDAALAECQTAGVVFGGGDGLGHGGLANLPGAKFTMLEYEFS